MSDPIHPHIGMRFDDIETLDEGYRYAYDENRIVVQMAKKETGLKAKAIFVDEFIHAVDEHDLLEHNFYSGRQMGKTNLTMASLEHTIKDSGERRTFDTGAVRDMSSGKGRYDLLPPEAISAYAKHMENGAVKYDERNWEKGIPLHSFLDSALRHLYKYLAGAKDEDHLVAAFWNIGNLIATRDRINAGSLPETLDDLPNGR